MNYNIREPNLSADKKYWVVRSFAQIVISDRGTLFYPTIRGEGGEGFRGHGPSNTTGNKFLVTDCY
jgi:hypothetical protein